MSVPDRREMLDRADKALSIGRQCALLCVARSTVYRAKRPANDNDLIVMRRIDELFTAYPFYGSRRMTLQLRSEGRDINRKRVQRIMRTMGIVALGPKPNTSKPAPGHKIYPYLLRGLKNARSENRTSQSRVVRRHYLHSDRPGFSLPRGGDGLGEPRGTVVAGVEHRGRLVSRVEGLEEALAKYGKPEIFNTDRGRKFSGMDFTGVLLKAGIQISHRIARRDPLRIAMGWTRTLDGQRFHRAPVAFLEIRGHLSEAPCRRARSQGRHFHLGRLLQHKALSSGATKPDADGGPTRQVRRIDWRRPWICGQRKSVAHSPPLAIPSSFA